MHMYTHTQAKAMADISVAASGTDINGLPQAPYCKLSLITLSSHDLILRHYWYNCNIKCSDIFIFEGKIEALLLQHTQLASTV